MQPLSNTIKDSGVVPYATTPQYSAVTTSVSLPIKTPDIQYSTDSSTLYTTKPFFTPSTTTIAASSTTATTPSSTATTKPSTTTTPTTKTDTPSTTKTDTPSTTKTDTPSTTKTDTPSTTKTDTPSTTKTDTPSTTKTDTPSTSSTTDTSINSVAEQIKTNFYSLMSNRLFFYCSAIIITLLFAFFIFFRGYSAEGIITSVIIDMIIIFLTIVITTYYYVSSTINKEDLFKRTMDTLEKWFNDSKNVFITIIVIIIFYTFLLIIGAPMSRELKPITIRIIETKLWIALLLSIINEGIKLLFHVNLADLCIEQLYNLWNFLHPNNKIEMEIKIPATVDTTSNLTVDKTSPIVTNTDEVYNIANNSHTYQDAQAVCKSLDARLATYDEIENSYEKGGEWCNYGWSDSQMILFPTQKSTWNELQKSSTNKNNCGRPGVNGGYLENSSKLFGVNCYGKKPNAKTLEEVGNKNNKNNVVKATKSREDIILDAKVKYWRENGDKLLTINSFNSNQWNEL